VTLTIRPYRPEDASAVWRVHERVLRARPLPFVENAPTHADLRAVENHYGPGEFLVGEVNSAVVATGAYRAVEAIGTATVEIRRMRVDPDQQRAGHGEAMLAELEGRARDRGSSGPAWRRRSTRRRPGPSTRRAATARPTGRPSTGWSASSTRSRCRHGRADEVT
jgi:GNAT superfamily N-acetyltransferase